MEKVSNHELTPACKTINGDTVYVFSERLDGDFEQRVPSLSFAGMTDHGDRLYTFTEPLCDPDDYI